MNKSITMVTLICVSLYASSDTALEGLGKFEIEQNSQTVAQKPIKEEYGNFNDLKNQNFQPTTKKLTKKERESFNDLKNQMKQDYENRQNYLNILSNQISGKKLFDQAKKDFEEIQRILADDTYGDIAYLKSLKKDYLDIRNKSNADKVDIMVSKIDQKIQKIQNSGGVK